MTSRPPLSVDRGSVEFDPNTRTIREEEPTAQEYAHNDWLSPLQFVSCHLIIQRGPVLSREYLVYAQKGVEQLAKIQPGISGHVSLDQLDGKQGGEEIHEDYEQGHVHKTIEVPEDNQLT